MNKFKKNLCLSYLFSFLFFDFIYFIDATKKVNASYFSQIEKKRNLISAKNKSFKNDEIIFDKLKFVDFLKNDFFELTNKFANSLVNDDRNKKEAFNLDIESDIQYQENEVFYAEGNASIYFPKGELKADKISYDTNKKVLTAEGNVFFKKGKQYFECSFLTYNVETEFGYLDDVYGVIDVSNFKKDFSSDSKKKQRNFSDSFKNEGTFSEVISSDVKGIQLKGEASIGLTNTFEQDRKLNITDLEFDIPQVTKWRFKAKRINIKSQVISSNKIYFTNDLFNKPQFVLENRKFSGQIVDDKLNLKSKNSWVIFDDLIKFPIGRRNIVDRDPISRWSIGTDHKDKDGFYISRSSNSYKILDDFEIKYTPFFLIQRYFKGTNKAYVAKGESILSEKIDTNNNFEDLFALETKLKGEIGDWKLNLRTIFNSFKFAKFNETTRSTLTLKKTLTLHDPFVDKDNAFFDKLKNDSEIKFRNFFDVKFYGAYRKEVSRGFSGDQEIYFGKGLTLSNRRNWSNNGKNSNLKFSYDLGEFTAESSKIKELKTLTRNTFQVSYGNKIPIYKKKSIDKTIDSSYRYYPEVVKQGINWVTDINAGVLYYGDGSSQEAISLNSGPEFIFGSFKKKYFDYTNFKVLGTYVRKSGVSPFLFDNIDDTNRLQLTLSQQIIGPLLLSFETYVNLEDTKNFGDFSETTYRLDIKRRAYSVGAFYNTESDEFGINFNIFNFDYAGNPPKF